jgi:hypothetical protein
MCQQRLDNLPKKKKTTLMANLALVNSKKSFSVDLNE